MYYTVAQQIAFELGIMDGNEIAALNAAVSYGQDGTVIR